MLATPQAALRAYIAATNSHDFERVREVLGPEPVFWFSDRACTGIPAVREYFESAWRIIDDEVYTAHDERWLAVGSDVAICIYEYRYSGFSSGNPVTGTGRATNAFAVDEHGEWRLVHEHLSPDPTA